MSKNSTINVLILLLIIPVTAVHIFTLFRIMFTTIFKS